jgi:hypothetical protein
MLTNSNGHFKYAIHLPAGKANETNGFALHDIDAFTTILSPSPGRECSSPPQARTRADQSAAGQIVAATHENDGRGLNKPPTAGNQSNKT